VCPLVDPWARGYFHWLVDALTKLEGVERYAAATGVEPTLVIPESPPSWMRRSLELAGYDPDDCLRWDGRTRTFDRVVVPSTRRRVDAPSIDALRWLRERMASNAEPSRDEWPSRVYISRRKARNRQVVNEPELEARLEERGFETYVLEELSVDDQIALFSGADVVFGLHGAGFTNALFASDATVIELFGSTVYSTVYYHMASGLGFQYGAVRCPSVARDVAVDPDRVVPIVDRMLE
jgi:capsular polysaccharide biosynthesis protein